MLQENKLAPLFTVLNQDNETITLSSYAGNKNIILYFYPKDDTPGCTIEANQFTHLVNEFAEKDTIILGVSKDSCQSHQDFIQKFKLKIDLLADVDGTLCDAYGVWQEKEKNGIKKMGIVRSTFLIDKEGMLKYIEYGVSAEGHAQEMLARVKKL